MARLIRNKPEIYTTPRDVTFAPGPGLSPSLIAGRANEMRDNEPMWAVIEAQRSEVHGARFAAEDDPGSRLDGLAAIRALEQREHPHWIVESMATAHPALHRAGIRLRHCHDLELTERILAGREGDFTGPDRAPVASTEPGLFDPPSVSGAATAGPAGPAGTAATADSPGPSATAGPSDPGDADGTAGRLRRLFARYGDQRGRIAESAGGAGARARGIDVAAGALRLLLAAESGSALVAAEMTALGLPWDADRHRQLLAEALGPRPVAGARPAKLAALADAVADAFGLPVNPDSPAEVLSALRRSGIDVASTRKWVLQEVDHPAIAPLLAYKELARLWTANGWHWLEEWISPAGRLAAQFLPGAVVSGRWATRGGGGLQIPVAIRSAAVAKPGYSLVVADAAQLEPRVLAAVSKDPALADLARADDLYLALAADGFGGDRRHAKLAMLGAMYGQTSGEAARLMATMTVRYPLAVGFVAAAAERGETGAVVRSVLGRACPPPSEQWRSIVGSGAESARRVARDRGRFTRNFVIQASAADWASVWMTTVRLALIDAVPAAEIVFFQHDELVVHAPEDSSAEVAALTVDAARRARDLVFPGSSVELPVRPQQVRCYADAK